LGRGIREDSGGDENVIMKMYKNKLSWNRLRFIENVKS
jgi:hypothetical protein